MNTKLNSMLQEALNSAKQEDFQAIRHCKHVRTTGVRCKSIALNGQDFCYYHYRDHQRRSVISAGLGQRRCGYAPQLSADGHGVRGSNAQRIEWDDDSAAIFNELQIPLLEDAHAIQICITNISRALATQQVSIERGSRLLYAMQLAMSNLANMAKESFRDTIAKTPVVTEDSDPLPMTGFSKSLHPHETT